MLLKLEDGTYFDTTDSVVFNAVTYGEVNRVQVVTPHTGGNPRVLRSGFDSIDDAREALDDLMSDQDVFEIEPPEEDEESDEDVDEYGYNKYADPNSQTQLPHNTIARQGGLAPGVGEVVRTPGGKDERVQGSTEDTEEFDEDDEESEVVEDDDYPMWTNSQLREELKNRRDADGNSLPSDGNKNILIQRLRDDDARRVEEDAANEDEEV
jgi:hypothetical protein